MIVLERKKVQGVFQFRLNLLIKISYIPDLKKNIQGFNSYGQKKISFNHLLKKKIFYVVIYLKLAKLIWSVKLTFSLKLISTAFLQQLNTHK